MSQDKKPQTAALRLQSLGSSLKRAYQNAGDHIADALSPIEEAVGEIDEPWLPEHFAEALKTEGPDKAHRPRSCFSTETFANGDKADYVLCVGRKRDRRCGLHVSYCQYAVKPAENPTGAKRSDVVIRESFVVFPDKLPVPMRLKILDVLDAFAEEYEAHVRKVRGDILDRFGQDSPFEGAVFSPKDAEKKNAEPVSSAAPESPEPTSTEGGAALRPDNVSVREDQAPVEANPDDDTVLEETKPADEEEVRADVPDPLADPVPVRPEDETVPDEVVSASMRDVLATPAASRDEKKKAKDEEGKRARPHAVPSAKLEEAESKIPLKAWI